MNNIAEEGIKYIIARLLDNAKDTMAEYKENKNDDFLQGKQLAYFEVIDTIKNELIVRDADLSEFGLSENGEQMFM